MVPALFGLACWVPTCCCGNPGSGGLANPLKIPRHLALFIPPLWPCPHSLPSQPPCCDLPDRPSGIGLPCGAPICSGCHGASLPKSGDLGSDLVLPDLLCGSGPLPSLSLGFFDCDKRVFISVGGTQLLRLPRPALGVQAGGCTVSSLGVAGSQRLRLVVTAELGPSLKP